ncbi:hypothetical protein EJB05_57636, partial [Eragrostis curvula]
MYIFVTDIDRKEEGNGDIEPGQLNLMVLRAATNNFSEANKLGEGGFREVFKGTLPNGEEIAVKKLSRHSSQGFSELKTELVLAAKLKHRNLVQLMGVCLQEEKLLIYEYMPNRSLDTFLFDPVRQLQLDWSRRFDIMCGIARGLLYLHEESRLKVIHRDLKPSNVLLDAEMNPKISDFGLARAFGGDQSRDITRRPVGTLGYMSPEYAYYGHVSTKSDMFSFGVIVLEMVTGRRNNSTYECADSVSLLSYVWGKGTTGSTIEVVDPSLDGHYPEDEVLNCVEIGLLCVQENPADRPDASAVALMLSSHSATDERHPPSRPAFVFGSGHSRTPYGLPAGAGSREGALIRDEQPSTGPISENEVTMSELQPSDHSALLASLPDHSQSSSRSGHNRRRGLFLLAVVASILTVATSVVNPVWIDCQTATLPPSPSPSPPPSSSANSSAFRSNVAALLGTLPTTAALTGFAVLSRGTGAGRAFVRGLCRGDAAPADCASYLRIAAAGIISRCNGSTLRAAVWYDKSFVSYGDTNASTANEDTFRQILYNSGKSATRTPSRRRTTRS